MSPLQIAFMSDSDRNFEYAFQSYSSNCNVLGLFSQVQQLDPTQTYNIFVVDVRSTGVSTLAMMRTLRSKYAHAKIIAVCSASNMNLAQALLRMGVTGIVLSRELTENFTHIVQTAGVGRIVISPAILKILVPPTAQHHDVYEVS